MMSDLLEYKRDRERANAHLPLTHSLDYGKEQAGMKHTCETSGCADKTKTCTKCGEVKTLTEFHRRPSRASGHVSHCKTCIKAKTKEYNAANRERRRANDKAYYEAHRTERIRWQREYYAANREARIAANREYYAANSEKLCALSRAWYRENRNYAISYRRKRYVETFEVAAEKRRAYYNKNRETIREKKREYRAKKWAEDPEFRAQFYAANIRRKRLLEGAAQEPYVRELIFKRDRWSCQLCGKKIDQDKRWPHPESASIDHIVPLSLGGDDTPDNVQAAHLSCNVGKGNRVDHDKRTA